MSRIVFTSQEINHDTGEVFISKSIKKEVKTKEEFVLLYIKHIGCIAQLPHCQLQTLLCLAPCIEWNTGEFTLDIRTMEKITACAGIKAATIRNAITELKKKNIVQRLKTNWYKLNPDIFWQGTELERQKRFELSYQWDVKE